MFNTAEIGKTAVGNSAQIETGIDDSLAGAVLIFFADQFAEIAVISF